MSGFAEKVRRLGYLPWILLAPPAAAAFLILLSVLADRMFPWPEAQRILAERNPSLIVCMALQSRTERFGAEVSGERSRTYIVFRKGSAPTTFTLQRELPNGEIQISEGTLGAVAPAVLAAFFGAALFAFWRAIGGSASPPPLLSDSRSRSERNDLNGLLYTAGSWVAWLSLVSWVGLVVFAIAGIATEGELSAFRESPLVEGLSSGFEVVVLASWLSAIVLWTRLEGNRTEHVLTLVLLIFCGAFWSFGYLLAKLPLLRPRAAPPRDPGARGAGRDV